MTRIVATALTVLLALIALTSSAFAQTITATVFTVSLPLVVNAVAAPTVVPTPVPDACGAVNRAFELEVLRLINAERAKVGLSALVEDKSLTVAARCHAIDMAVNDFLSHTGSNGSKPGERVIAAGYSGNYAGEIAGKGFTAPQEMVDSWMSSPPHRTILLSSTATEFGAGYGYNSAFDWSSRWAVDLGTR